MKRIVLRTVLATCAVWPAFSQPADAPPQFEAADVRVSPKAQNPFLRTAPVRGGRYQVKYATMVDLIHLAYGFDNDKILGGPSWLEMDRFDVTAKVPADSTPDTQKLALQSLLADRFKLVARKDTKPLPTYALVAGKKPQLKEAEGTEASGCKLQSQSGGGPEGRGMAIMVGSAVAGGGDGAPVRISIGPGGTVQYACRNMTMEAFASGLRTMFGASLGPNPVIEDTGLKGRWNFDLRWSIQMFGPMGNANQGDRITIFEAVEKQLGLKLEERQVPTPVMIVDSVNQKPTANPPGTADILPIAPPPTEFEVASVKPADTSGGRAMSMFRPQAGGRFTATGMPMTFLLNQAFNVNNSDQIAGMPAWADSERFDIVAKAPSEGDAMPTVDRDVLAPMIRSLLADRFKMTYHTEDRQVSAYTLVAGKPKMKKADPASRTYCKNAPPPPGAPPASQVLNCQNVTMAQFAERLQRASPELNWPVADATGLAGTWDFTLTFSFNFGMMAMRSGGGDGVLGGVAGGAPAASDPNGGLTIFEAIEKQLGLKLEKQKRSMPVIVIDRLEQKPTEN
jgi:uncharacterized protein (TIGR03435 family)